jgi:7,8-dihydropterin-6-yl-methyl-4-(beta-D-ribofuranosyl)aminobenzene 5'-phosphate synthase
MKVKILYDNEADPGLSEGWGFSCLISMEDEKILFDTGWDGSKLLSNMAKTGEKTGDIERIVLSHSDWDHVGGLNHLEVPDAQVWVPDSFSKHMKMEIGSRFDLHEVTGPREIMEGVWTTGELGRDKKEQSLVIEVSNGVLVIVGCSHPGVPQVLDSAGRFGKPWGIVGGMHGFDEYEVLRGLELIVPTHCTVNKQRILDLFPEKTVEGRVGLVLELN